MKKKIGILGIFPPPFGGVSTHCYRLAKGLSKINEFEIYAIDMLPSYSGVEESQFLSAYIPIKNRVIFGLRLLLERNFDLIHYHGNNPFTFSLIVLSLISKFKIPVVITLHSFRKKIPGKLCKTIKIRVLNNLSKIICVNQEISESLKKLGIQEEILTTISPFIFPDKNNNEVTPTLIKNSKSILLANVTRFETFEGCDLYGTDMYIQLAKFLKDRIQNFVLIIVISIIDDTDKFEEYKSLICELKLEDNIIFREGNSDLIPLIRISDLLIRATNSDSFGMSVAEAVSLGVPAVASNVVRRPKGTITFNSRNQDDFNRTVFEVLTNLKYHKERIRDIEFSDRVVSNISKVYKDVFQKSDY